MKLADANEGHARTLRLETHSVRLILAILAPLQLCVRELDLAGNTSDGSADE